MPRLPNISKYCVSCRSAALVSLNEYSILTPSTGRCCTPLTETGSGRPAPSGVRGAPPLEGPLLYAVNRARLGQPRRFEDRRCHVDDVVKLRADFALGLDAIRPVHD